VKRFALPIWTLALLLAFMPLATPKVGEARGANLDAAANSPALVDWSDNYDSYATGSQLHGQGGWKGWFNDPAAGALTSAAQAHSAPNSAAIVGASDLVHEYSGYTSGQWIYTAWQYVPAGFSGITYFILLNSYDDGGLNLNWSTQVNFDSALGQVVNDGATGGTLPLVTGQWVEIRVEIDLDADTQDFYYNNQLLFAGTWTEEQSGGGVLNIGAVDLFANNASVVYYDDVSLVEVVPAISLTKTVGTNPAVCPATGAITVTVGTLVNYCYAILNTGPITLTLHDLVDDQLGALLTGFPYTLAPGASAFLTQTATITQTTVNTAVWTAYNPGPIDVISSTASATVNVLAPAAVDVAAVTATSGSPASLVLTLTLPLAIALLALGGLVLARKRR